ncbi:MAG: PepSY domain-containing protein [Jiangellaceae bacterium]
MPASADAAISAPEAVEIAGRELAGGGSAPPVDRLDLKFEDGRLIWDVEFVGDHKVEVDATTGAIVKFELGDDDHGDDDNSGRGGHDDGPNHD